jgi:phage terminase small subunit
MEPIKSKRVPRFVEEYAKDRNGTQAAIRAGYSVNSAGEQAVALLADPRVQAMVQAEQERVSKLANVEAAFVLQQWLELATADPSRVVNVRRVNCRHCWGIGGEYQWSAREYAKAFDAAINSGVKLPECTGGFGWKHNAEPNLDCSECNGEGREDVFIADTSALTGPERKLIAAVETTKDGVKIKMRDQDGAVKNLASYLGMLIEKRELTGKDGQPLGVAVLPVELPSDPKQLGDLYSKLVGGR